MINPDIGNQRPLLKENRSNTNNRYTQVNNYLWKNTSIVNTYLSNEQLHLSESPIQSKRFFKRHLLKSKSVLTCFSPL